MTPELELLATKLKLMTPAPWTHINTSIDFHTDWAFLVILRNSADALIARLRLADELVAALSSVASEDEVKNTLSCYVQGAELMECLRRWHGGEGECIPG